MFRRFLNWLRQVMNKMFGINNIEHVVTDSIISSEMASAIDDWMDLYMGKCPWLKDENQSLGLPEQIAAEIARLVTLEMEVNITDSTERGVFIKKTLEPLLKGIRIFVEYGCAGGGLMFKPCVVGDSISIEMIQANKFIPTAFDSSGKITGAVFLTQKTIARDHFTRIERHELLADGKYRISNTAYSSNSDDVLGNPCSLSACPDWEDITPEVEAENVYHTLFSYFKIPLGNTVDPDSPLGVSVYARAVRLIRDADEQYQRLLWEYEGGELAIDASSEAFIIDRSTGKPMLPAGKERLFRMNELDASEYNKLMEVFSPTLRDQSILNGLDAILVKIEDQCGLSRGTLSNRFVDARTATEIIHTKQRSYATVSAIQTSLETALDDLVAAVDTLATLYELTPEESASDHFEVSYQWDDSIVVDAEAERLRDQQEVSQGLMLPWEYRKKWYGEDETTAKKALGEIDDLTDDDLMGFGNEPPKE